MEQYTALNTIVIFALAIVILLLSLVFYKLVNKITYLQGIVRNIEVALKFPGSDNTNKNFASFYALNTKVQQLERQLREVNSKATILVPYDPPRRSTLVLSEGDIHNGYQGKLVPVSEFLFTLIESGNIIAKVQEEKIIISNPNSIGKKKPQSKDQG